MSNESTAISQHPFYLVNHYNLLKKESNDAKDIQRSSLYFNDAGYLQYLLHEDEIDLKEEVIIASPEKPVAIEIPTWEQVQALTHRTPVITQDKPQESEIIDAGFAETGIEEQPASQNNVETLIHDNVIDDFEEILVSKEGKKDIETIQEPAQENIETENIILPTEEIEIKPQEETDAKEETEDLISNKLSSMLNDQLAAFKKPVADDEQIPIATEPFHTVDYFASQGIKLDLAGANDQFTKRVRKFTDWLKDMKTTPQPKIQLQNDAEREIKVQQTANESNEINDIITESMAEVLTKQGKVSAAIELYEKLSFLNPEKTAYFAAKISHLKEL